MTSVTVDFGSETLHGGAERKQVGEAGAVPETRAAAASHGLSASSKVRRIARGLASAVAGAGTDKLIFGELGFGKRSAVWFTLAVAEALAEVLGTTVTVVALADGRQRHAAESGMGPRAGRRVHLEWIDTGAVSPLRLGAVLDERLQVLQADREADKEAHKGTTLLHLAETSPMDLLSHLEGCAGVVLLSRAGKTRKAAVESFQARLQQLELALLGAVLLDREYPIPAALYKLL